MRLVFPLGSNVGPKAHKWCINMSKECGETF